VDTGATASMPTKAMKAAMLRWLQERMSSRCSLFRSVVTFASTCANRVKQALTAPRPHRANRCCLPPDRQIRQYWWWRPPRIGREVRTPSRSILAWPEVTTRVRDSQRRSSIAYWRRLSFLRSCGPKSLNTSKKNPPVCTATAKRSDADLPLSFQSNAGPMSEKSFRLQPESRIADNSVAADPEQETSRRSIP
jgi:hypothetical protein